MVRTSLAQLGIFAREDGFEESSDPESNEVESRVGFRAQDLHGAVEVIVEETLEAGAARR